MKQAKIRFEDQSELEEWANEVQDLLINLKKQLDELSNEVKNIKETKKKRSGVFEWGK